MKPQLLSLVMVLLVTAAVSAENTQCVPVPDEYRPENILGFARHLVKVREYYGAYTEIQRLESYYPGYLALDKYHVTENYLLFRGGRYADLLSLKSSHASPAADAACSLFKYDSMLRLSEPEKARAWINKCCADPPAELALFVYKRRVLADILLNDFDDIRNIYADYSGYGFTTYDDIIVYSSKRMSELKSPVSAAAMGILPGMGYAYSGYVNTGIVAFLVVSVNALLTMFALRSGNDGIAVLTGSAGVFFYSGSILGGYMAAARHNRQIMSSLGSYAGDYFELAKDRDFMYTRYGIGNGR